MGDALLPTLARVLLPAAAIGVMLLVARRKRLSLAGDLGLQRPAVGPAVGWLGLWIVLILVEELLAGAETRPKPWAGMAPSIVALRVLAIGLLGPVAEELAFRGLLMAGLRRTRLGAPGAILLSALLWAALHLQYQPLLLGLIVIDGIALGLARHMTGSLLVPIVMHVLGNLVSIVQSLSA